LAQLQCQQPLHNGGGVFSTDNAALNGVAEFALRQFEVRAARHGWLSPLVVTLKEHPFSPARFPQYKEILVNSRQVRLKLQPSLIVQPVLPSIVDSWLPPACPRRIAGI